MRDLIVLLRERSAAKRSENNLLARRYLLRRELELARKFHRRQSNTSTRGASPKSVNPYAPPFDSGGGGFGKWKVQAPPPPSVSGPRFADRFAAMRKGNGQGHAPLMEGHGRLMEGHGRSWKAMEGHAHLMDGSGHSLLSELSGPPVEVRDCH